MMSNSDETEKFTNVCHYCFEIKNFDKEELQNNSNKM